jgi:hypothetical protein
MVEQMFLFIGCALPFLRFTAFASYHRLQLRVKMFWYEFCCENEILAGV